ncbi:MAG: hypothetical protein GX946_01940 [Oligosphaeraceae bacterium]|nr:hypothetical protein [Oligosphaeraceae bacterium]
MGDGRVTSLDQNSLVDNLRVSATLYCGKDAPYDGLRRLKDAYALYYLY